MPPEVRVAAAPVLPPKLAGLIAEQFQHGPRHSNMAGRGYLLPGHSPGRSRNPLGLADTLGHHGLPARAARNTAMMNALVDLPPMVIADLLGMHPRTAERWAAFAGGLPLATGSKGSDAGPAQRNPERYRQIRDQHGAREPRLVQFSANRVGWSRSGCRGGQDGLGGQPEIPDHRIRVALAADQDDLAGGSILDRDGDEVGTQ